MRQNKEEKKCRKCTEVKASLLFPKNRAICTMCRTEYQREYRGENKAKLALHRKLWYSKHRIETSLKGKIRYRNDSIYRKYRISYAKKRYDLNKESILAYRKQKYQENKEFYLEKSRIWQKNNPKKVRERNKRYLKRALENPEKRENILLWMRLKNLRRGARLRTSSDNTVTTEFIKEMYIQQKGKCNNLRCQVDLENRYHIDHIHPISKGGKHTASNVQLLCPFCNISKGARVHAPITT